MGRVADSGTDGRGISETRSARVIRNTFCKLLPEELGSTQEYHVLSFLLLLWCRLAGLRPGPHPANRRPCWCGSYGALLCLLSAPRIQQRQSRYPLVGHIPLTCLPENG